MKDNKRPGQQLKGLSVQELLGVTNEESAMEIDIRLIHPFKDHPFKVIDDEKMQDLVESIKLNGVLSPVLLREAGDLRTQKNACCTVGRTGSNSGIHSRYDR